MKNQMLNKVGLTLLFILNAPCLFAQQTFKYKAALPKIDSDNFYRISLQPALTSKSKADLSDIRVSDQSGKAVPYIFGDQLPSGDKKDFVELPTLQPVINNDTVTIFRVQNLKHVNISQLFLKLRNTAVQRNVDISGSDDLKLWYAIKEDITLNPATSNSNGIYEQMFNFPSSNYKYFKITVNHKNHQPVAILQAGIYQQLTTGPSYIQIPNASITQKDSAKTSYITLKFDAAYQLNQLQFVLTGAKFYKRKATLYQLDNGQRSYIGETELASQSIPTINLSAKAATILMEIDNQDNPALIVRSVKAFQLDQALICYLEKDKQYNILFGDSTATAPQYDIKAFTDSLHQQLPVIAPQEIKNNSSFQVKTVSTNTGIPGWIIWAAIALVVGLLATLTFKMTAEVKKREV